MLSVDAAPRGHVWIADDSPLERELVRRALEDRFDVVVFEDGGALLEALGQREPPELLILDWEMPSLSGRDVCVFVRGSAGLAELPIMILTGSVETLVDALEAGANDYVVKPFHLAELNARAATLVALHRTHRKLVHAEQQLREEADFREKFIGILAHDLRQPLNTVMIAAEIFSPDGSANTVGIRARKAALRMVRMIDELLDFTRSRIGGGMPVTRVEGHLADIVSRAVEEEASDSVLFVTEGDTHGTWDDDRMAQVCGNLIGNAREYGAKGRPISVRVIGSPSEVVLEVHNEGPAIPSAALSTLFDPFRRGPVLNGAPTGRGAGLGLGLFIVDQIVRAHDGTLNVRSGEGGTTFVVRIPRRTSVRLG